MSRLPVMNMLVACNAQFAILVASPSFVCASCSRCTNIVHSVGKRVRSSRERMLLVSTSWETIVVLTSHCCILLAVPKTVCNLCYRQSQ